MENDDQKGQPYTYLNGRTCKQFGVTLSHEREDKIKYTKLAQATMIKS